MDALFSPTLCVASQVQTVMKADATIQSYLGSSPVRFWKDEAQLGYGYPFGRITISPQKDLLGDTALYQTTTVKALISFHAEDGNYDTIQALAYRAQQLLVKVPFSNAYGICYSCIRVQEWAPPDENESNKVYIALGHYYQFEIKAAR